MLKREATSLVTFYGISPIHAGAGASTSVVDLPIQRERHTNWPHIQASAVKGAMRQHFRRYAETVLKDNKKANEFINYIFGYDGDNDNNKEVHKDTEDTTIKKQMSLSIIFLDMTAIMIITKKSTKTQKILAKLFRMQE